MNASSKITGNFGGGGVGVSTIGTFVMRGGEISNNTAYTGGGVFNRGVFTMSDGEISGNTSSNPGGGVYTVGTFNMSGGEISGNTSSYGGGVYAGGTFNKTGGSIFGYSSSNNNSNVVKDGSGVVQQNRGHAVHVNHNSGNTFYRMGKDTTSGPMDNLSFNGAVTPHTYSGMWDYKEQEQYEEGEGGR